MLSFYFFILPLTVCILIGVIAQMSKGRTGFFWFLGSLVVYGITMFSTYYYSINNQVDATGELLLKVCGIFGSGATAVLMLIGVATLPDIRVNRRAQNFNQSDSQCELDNNKD